MIQLEAPGSSAQGPAAFRISGKLNVKGICEKVGFKALPWQKELFNIMAGDNRFIAVPGGKRSGKSEAVSIRGLLELFRPGSLTWVVAPSYELCTRIFSRLERWSYLHFPFIKVTTKNNQPILENVQTLSTLRIKSGDSKENLKGDNPSLLLFDEAGDESNDVWYEYLQPNVSQKFTWPDGSKANPQSLFIGNTKQKNFFFDIYQRGLNHEEGYASLHVPTAIEDADGNIIASSNPEALSVEELIRIKLQTPQDIWRADWLAMFNQEDGAVFRNLKEIFRSEQFLGLCQRGHSYSFGLDPAKHVDFNVVIGICRNCHVVKFVDRSNKLDYVFQKVRLLENIKLFGGKENVEVTMDSTGPGESIYDELDRNGIYISPFNFSRLNAKKDLVEKLVLFIEHNRIFIPDCQETQELKTELENFGRLDAQGKLKYEAPNGKHDDCVMALALAVWPLDVEPEKTDKYKLSEEYGLYATTY